MINEDQALADGELDRMMEAIHLDIYDKALREQCEVFVTALRVYAERNEKYNDNWRRMGWRGCLVRIRERAERLWDNLWDANDPDTPGPLDGPTWRGHDVDDAIDLINFCGFLVRGVREGNRDGEWWS